MKLKQTTIKTLLILTLGLTTFSFIGVSTARANKADPLPDQETDSDLCLLCHNGSDQTMVFENGEELAITINKDAYRSSLHGDLECSNCHPDLETYPHPEQDAKTPRDYSIKYHDSCIGCHPTQFNETSMSIHEQLFNEGNIEAPLCADCHQPHSQVHLYAEDEISLIESKIWITDICANCHIEMFDLYASSKHGEGLIEDQNPDMPSCIDCHNVHDICDPDDGNFRTQSLDTCAKCHTDPKIMEKYGKSVNVLNTYLVFHDTTVTMLEKYNPDELTNKPTCYDCHGIHNISNMSNPPPKVFDMPGADQYPPIDVEEEPVEPMNIAFTGAVVGLLLGGAGTLTISQLIKERKNGMEEKE
jgi:nitrate/TMAO reductase-like tetraheme cytochrome c subunit